MSVRVDWFRVITDLDRAGLDYAQQAREVETTARTIRRWRTGDVDDPPYSKANKLLDIYQTVLGSTPPCCEDTYMALIT